MLDRYLEGLVKEAEQNEKNKALADLSFDDLAKLAGIKRGHVKKALANPLPAIGAAIGRGASATGSAVTRGGAAVGEAVSRGAGAAQNLGKSMVNAYQLGTQGIRRAGSSLVPHKSTGVLGGLGAVAERHPVATGVAAAVPVVGGAAALAPSHSKQAGVTGNELLEIGDAAGRLLAKMAAMPQSVEGVPVSELKESLEEAKERESVPMRSKHWGIGGGVAGGALGGLTGLGTGLLLRRLGVPHAAGIGAGVGALGTIGGGALGAHLGAQHGAEEAKADKLLEELRGRQAFSQGAQEGYMGALEQMGGNSPF